VARVACSLFSLATMQYFVKTITNLRLPPLVHKMTKLPSEASKVDNFAVLVRKTAIVYKVGRFVFLTGSLIYSFSLVISRRHSQFYKIAYDLSIYGLINRFRFRFDAHARFAVTYDE
jgi:hypothetical protein